MKAGENLQGERRHVKTKTISNLSNLQECENLELYLVVDFSDRHMVQAQTQQVAALEQTTPLRRNEEGGPEGHGMYVMSYRSIGSVYLITL